MVSWYHFDTLGGRHPVESVISSLPDLIVQQKKLWPATLHVYGIEPTKLNMTENCNIISIKELLNLRVIIVLCRRIIGHSRTADWFGTVS
jgi:hypothetical protein